MATYILGALLVVALFFALRHIYWNFRDGKEDCCGGDSHSGSCSHCSGCNAEQTKK